MNGNLNLLFAFVGGAVVGAGVALLMAPEKGEDLRTHIKEMLHKKGLGNCCDTQMDTILEKMTNIE